MKIKTQFNQSFKDAVKEEFKTPSMTIPNQSMSIPELISRYAKGLPLGGARVPVYEDDSEDLLDGVNWNTLDLSEKASFMDMMRKEVSDIKGRLKESQKKKTEEKPKEE